MTGGMMMATWMVAWITMTANAMTITITATVVIATVIVVVMISLIFNRDSKIKSNAKTIEL